MLPAQFKHDCDLCRFIGRYDKYDFYWCKSKECIGSVIARYGDNGHEYMSCPADIIKTMNTAFQVQRKEVYPLRIAFFIVQELGLENDST
jgi:hypothetical protein